MSTKSTSPRRQPEPHATRVYLLVDRNTGKAFDCACTRVEAAVRRDAHAHGGPTARFAKRDIRIVPATATPTPPKGKAGAP